MTFLYINSYVFRPLDMIHRGLELIVIVHSQCKMFICCYFPRHYHDDSSNRTRNNILNISLSFYFVLDRNK